MFSKILTLFLATGFALAADSPVPAGWDKGDLGKLPRGWKSHATGAKPATEWKLRADATAPSRSGLVLTQTGASPNPVFNLCVSDRPSMADVELSVSFKALTGKKDQGGGLVWRFQDAKNYYVARMNPLEDNFRVYKVIDGVRKQLATKEDLTVKAGTWHTIAIRMKGDRIECLLDGKKHLEATDSAIGKAGKVGLWTKADAVTSFDGFRVGR